MLVVVIKKMIERATTAILSIELTAAYGLWLMAYDLWLVACLGVVEGEGETCVAYISHFNMFEWGRPRHTKPGLELSFNPVFASEQCALRRLGLSFQ